MSKMLIVDDEEKIRAVVREYAEFEEFEVTEARDGMEAVALCRENDYDIIIMDVMMPRLYDKLFGFETGIDDYVVKPFSPRELMARVRAVLARSHAAKQGGGDTQQRLKFGGLEIDLAGREVYVDGVRASMTPKEYDLLFYLVKNKGLALSRDKLLEEVWGYDFFGDDRTVDTHIKMLRGNLGPYRSDIVTLRGMGYKFDPENDASPASSR